LTTPGGAESVTGDIIVLPMQKGSPVDPGQPVPPPIFYIPPDRGHGFGLVHLARALGPQWSVSVVRPANMRHPSTVTAIEESAARCVAAIRAEQPTGPYLLTGGCYGGIVAFEAARLLEAQGEHLALILMDVPIPGYPQAIGHPRHASAHWRLLRATLRDLSKKGRKRHYLRIARRKVLWNIGLRTRPLMARFAHRRTIRRLIDEAMTNDLPFYRLRQTSIPILHLLATERPDVVARESYLGWDRLAIGGLTCHTFSGNHLNWFGGGNSPLILKAIRKWIETQSFLFR